MGCLTKRGSDKERHYKMQLAKVDMDTKKEYRTQNCIFRRVHLGGICTYTVYTGVHYGSATYFKDGRDSLQV